MCVCIDIDIYIHCTGCALRGDGLLQVAVDFEAVVAGISNNNVSVRGERQSLRAIEWIC